MCGRKYATELRYIRVLIYYDKTKRHVFFCHILVWHSFTWVFSSNAVAWSFSTTWKRGLNPPWRIRMSLTPVKLLKASAEMQVAPRRCWPRRLSFTGYISLYCICSQLSTVKGAQFWRAPTSSISTPHNSENCQYHMVPEQGRHRHYLSWVLCTHPIRSYCPCTHGGKDRSFELLPWILTGCTRCHQIECCIGEWTTGTCKKSSWEEVHYKANYLSHLNSLRDLDKRGTHQNGRDLLRRIQEDLLKDAR